MSASEKQKIFLKKLADSRRGKKTFPCSEERRIKTSQALKGKKKPPRTLEHQKHINEALKGRKFSEEHKKNLSLARIGRKHSEETKIKLRKPKSEEHKQKLRKPKSLEARRKMSEARKGKYLGENSPNWIKDRTLIKFEDRRGIIYTDWQQGVYKRDIYKCKISNQDCSGAIVAHHILPWRDYPELRYDVNNGITLCKFHHPRKWVEESRLSSYFQSLIVI